MPELPEISVLSRQMKEGLVGKTFAGSDVLQPKCLNISPEAFADGLMGARIVEIGRAHV